MRGIPRRSAIVLIALASASARSQEPARPTAPPKLSFAEPGIAPNGEEIAFVHAGDIWVVPARGGEARLLVAHPANESRPVYSPDGTRLTFDDGAEQLDGWSRDGRWIYFSTGTHDISSMSDVYRVKSDGGTPMPVAGDRYASEFMAAPAPNGDAVAIVGRDSVSQW